jgi:hypothetical protein
MGSGKVRPLAVQDRIHLAKLDHLQTFMALALIVIHAQFQKWRFYVHRERQLFDNYQPGQPIYGGHRLHCSQ